MSGNAIGSQASVMVQENDPKEETTSRAINLELIEDGQDSPTKLIDDT